MQLASHSCSSSVHLLNTERDSVFGVAVVVCETTVLEVI